MLPLKGKLTIAFSTLHLRMQGLWLTTRPHWHGLSVLLRRSYCLYLRVSMTGQWMCMKASFKPALCQLSRMGCPWSAGRKLSLFNQKQNLQLLFKLMDTWGFEDQSILPACAVKGTMWIRKAWRTTSSLQFHYSIVGLIVKFGLTNEMCDMIVLCSAQYAESVGYLTFIEFGRQIFHLLWVGGMQWPCLCMSSAIGYSHHAHWHGDTSSPICFGLCIAAGLWLG